MKILVISHNSFSKIYNNGKTLSAIFSSFEKSELCQLYFTPLGDLDHERCDSYFCITDKDAIISVFKRGMCGNSIQKECANNKRLTKIKKQNTFMLIMRSVIWSISNWRYGGLNDWLLEQSPDAIFYVGGNSIFSHKIAIRLSKDLKIPLATYFTDDYVLNPPSNIYIKWLKSCYKKTIAQSRLLFAIGNQMASDYTEYFKRQFLPIMNIVDVPNIQRTPQNINNSIRVNYFGGLHLGRAEEILRFSNFLQQNLSSDDFNRIELKVYSFDDVPESLLNQYHKLGISKEQGVTRQELIGLMQTTDIFLHVESIKPEYHSLTKLSISTKIPEYMSFAKPIIAFGPADVASFKVIAEVNPDLVIDDSKNCNRKCLDGIRKLFSDQDYILEKGQNNYNYAKLKFDKSRVATEFKNILSKQLYT